jgi:hypothetical protein
MTFLRQMLESCEKRPGGKKDVLWAFRSQLSACSQQTERPGTGQHPHAPSPTAPATVTSRPACEGALAAREGLGDHEGCSSRHPVNEKGLPWVEGFQSHTFTCGTLGLPLRAFRTIPTFVARMSQTAQAPCSTFSFIFHDFIAMGMYDAERAIPPGGDHWRRVWGTICGEGITACAGATLRWWINATFTSFSRFGFAADADGVYQVYHQGTIDA